MLTSLACKTRKTSMTKKTTEPEVKDRLSVRLDRPLAERFEKVVTVSKRSRTSIIEECLEEVLPKMEKQYLGV